MTFMISDMASLSPPVITAATTKVLPWLRFEKKYLHTLNGALKMLQIFVALCGFLCITFSNLSLHPRATWYYFVCLVSFWTSLLLLLCYAFHVVEKLHFLPWLGMELFFSSCWSVLYLTAAALATSFGHLQATWVAATIFACLGMSSHAWEAVLKLRDVRRGKIAQGHRSITASSDRLNKY
ncbi:plasmolipin-like [Amphibalanus amphitrite]|uniref:plasmolipin-like n=1 Tax=Amphibalanus amphitrite TaxID=1232801 RepID=UPI001C922A52|nr:plasmolipin-like [Amphibalanus amphitrite]